MEEHRVEYWKGIDRVFRLPRVWSNRELKKFAHMFNGSVANVSGWQDKDKEGSSYKQYFSECDEYILTNYKKEARGYQGYENEVFLDLVKDLPDDLKERFDVVFNHTVLEHIYDVNKAFENLCLMTKDIAIVVVPFLQEMHAEYGDFWRFTPMTMEKLFKENSMELIYCSFNSHPNASVYLFCIGSKNPAKWKKTISQEISYKDPYVSTNGFQNWVGCHAISMKNETGFYEWVKKTIKGILNKVKPK